MLPAVPNRKSGVQVFWGEMAAPEHLVQIYEREAAFLDSLEGFVGGGLESGEAAVVIATPAHRAELGDRLTRRGLDLAALTASDQYLALDAEETLGRFMRGGWPDEPLFANTVTEILARARQGGRRVRAFGEMVALLWARGDASATVQLEHLWHRLVEIEAFSLFCAYPRAGFPQDAMASMAALCAAHSRVIPEE
jgi:hypothetical protein